MLGEKDRHRSGTASAVFAVIVISLMAYLTFAAIQGEYGLIRLVQIEAEEAEAREELERLEARRATIANKTRRLSHGHLDLDLLDERARIVLGLGHPDEIMIR